jgi:hypothetical protein
MTESSFSYINSIVSNISLDFEIPICQIYHMYVRTFCSLACFAFPNGIYQLSIPSINGISYTHHFTDIRGGGATW